MVPRDEKKFGLLFPMFLSSQPHKTVVFLFQPKKSGTPGSLGGRVESFEPSGSRSKRFRALEAQRFRKTNGKNDPDPPITGWWFETLFLILTPTFLGRWSNLTSISICFRWVRWVGSTTNYIIMVQWKMDSSNRIVTFQILRNFPLNHDGWGKEFLGLTWRIIPWFVSG